MADTIDTGTDSAVFIEGTVFTNAAPSVDAGLTAAGLEGAAVQLLGSAIDAEGDPLTITWTYQPQIGVDRSASCVFTGSTTVSPQLRWTDDGTYVVTITASDGVNAPAESTTTVVVSNGSPTASIVAPIPNLVVAVDATASVQALITDAGANDTHTCEIHWGDGAVTSAPAVNNACSATHQYSAVGTRTVVVTATDDDGASGTDTRALAVASALPAVLGDGQVRVNGLNVQVGILAGPSAGRILVTSRAGGRLIGASVTSLTLSGGTATVSGRCLWNGRVGYTYTATVVDNGRNGRSGAPRDRFAVTVLDPAGTVAYAIATELVSGELVVRR